MTSSVTAAVPEINAAVAGTGYFRTCLAGFCQPGEFYSPATSLGFRVEHLTNPAPFRVRSGSSENAYFRGLVARSAGLHIHGLWQQGTALAACLARKAGKPYVISAHGMLERWALRNKGLKKAVYLALVERANLSGAACLHALTEQEARDYRRLGLRNRIVIIPNGVKLPESASAHSFLEAFHTLWASASFYSSAGFTSRKASTS